MKKILFLLCNFVLLTTMPDGAKAVVLEWSDINYIEGKYSRIYFDYQQLNLSQGGTFFVINDWMVNQDDGGLNGGLNPGEYNLFPFTWSNNKYEIRIYGDGSSAIFVNGVNNPNALLNFKSAFGWTTSPNEPNVDHTIWEFSFSVPLAMKITKFKTCDPFGSTVKVIYETPPPPSVITNGPSQYQHYVDGEFSDTELVSTSAPDPTRPYSEPEIDPWFEGITWTIDLHKGGGTTVTPVPLPPALLLFVSGLTGMLAYKTRDAST